MHVRVVTAVISVTILTTVHHSPLLILATCAMLNGVAAYLQSSIVLVSTYIHTYIYTLAYMRYIMPGTSYIHAYVHTYIYIHRYIDTYIYIYLYTYMLRTSAHAHSASWLIRFVSCCYE